MEEMNNNYKKNSITLMGAVSLGTGVMIGAGIFALIGQVAQFAGSMFPYAFILGAIVTSFSAYSYIKMSHAYPSAGGIAMFLSKAYGKGMTTAVAALLMAFSMIINESLVARTFANYTLQLFDINNMGFLIPVLGLGLILLSFIVNVSGNRFIESFSSVMAIVKIFGILIFAGAVFWVSGITFDVNSPIDTFFTQDGIGGYIASVAFCVLAFKGFTTITNSGSEIVEPHRNVGRAIVISIIICTIVYLLVAFAVAGSLSLDEIIKSKDYALAEASKPVLGNLGLWFTVFIAIIATVSGIIASVFAVSRMLAMITNMKLIPHNHFGMSGTVQRHTLVYTVVAAGVLTVLFNVSRIASMGAIFYLIMDIIIHWGVLKYLHREIKANPIILIIAIILDIIVLGAFLWVKVKSDIFVVVLSFVVIGFIVVVEKLFFNKNNIQKPNNHMDNM